MRSDPDAAPGLPAEQVERYRREGYLMLPRLFGPDDLAPIDACIRDLTRDCHARAAGDAVLELEPGSTHTDVAVRRIRDPYARHAAFRQLATDARLLDRVAALIGPDLGIQHSKLNMKPARLGSAVEWHQDLAYFPHTNDDMLAALIYLDDATEENGCLLVRPRQHHRMLSHEFTDGGFAGMITEELPEGGCDRAVPLPAPAGSVILMHCLTPHASLPNRSSASRRTLIFEFRAADAFPVYFSERVVDVERLAVHVRGQRARSARMGGPAQRIPRLGPEMKSLYDVQAAAKGR